MLRSLDFGKTRWWKMQPMAVIVKPIKFFLFFLPDFDMTPSHIVFKIQPKKSMYLSGTALGKVYQ
jgi:hypothetical protein